MRATLNRAAPGLVAELVIDRVAGAFATLHLIQADQPKAL